MTNDLTDGQLRARLIELKPDVVGTTSITPSIYKAEEVLKIASEVAPDSVRVLGGIHATFMYKQVLSEAPWIDVIVRGEGEEIFREVIRAIGSGDWPACRNNIKGLAFVDGELLGASIEGEGELQLRSHAQDCAGADGRLGGGGGSRLAGPRATRGA